ncbi:MAG: EF-hand domain-containing protein, partial [Comamonadaceae bacterium]
EANARGIATRHGIAGRHRVARLCSTAARGQAGRHRRAQPGRIRGRLRSAGACRRRPAAARTHGAGWLCLCKRAGLTSGSGAAQSGDPVAAGNSVTRGNAAGVGLGDSTPGGDAGPGTAAPGTGTGAAAGTAAAAGAAGQVARGPAQSVPLAASGLNPVEVARNFIQADSNRDGELTRAEAQRLGFAPSSFEEMDRDFDGVVTRAEYGDGMR